MLALLLAHELWIWSSSYDLYDGRKFDFFYWSDFKLNLVKVSVKRDQSYLILGFSHKLIEFDIFQLA